MTIVTTRGLSIKLEAGKRNLQRVTTKDVDTSIEVTKPTGEVVKSPIVSTHNMGDLADIAERRKRIAITKERNAVVAKKPWNKMNSAERKVYQAEKAKEDKAPLIATAPKASPSDVFQTYPVNQEEKK